jgi:catechol 2,3-dioxygenase-like lactoylglutathione lyase family enzyme
MRNKTETKDFYVNKLGFKNVEAWLWWLFMNKDNIEIHFFWI